MLAPQQTIVRASANLRCEGATAKLDFLWIFNALLSRAEAILSALQSASSAFKSILRLPMPVSESGSRCGRICSQTRSSLPPDSLTGLDFGILQCLPCSWGGVGRRWKVPFVFVRYVISSATFPFVWTNCKKKSPLRFQTVAGIFI